MSLSKWLRLGFSVLLSLSALIPFAKSAQGQNISLPNKTILIELRDFGGDGYFIGVVTLLPTFTLYQDGQLIYTRNDQMFEVWLSRAEMAALENRLAETGVFQVTGHGSDNALDPIYKNIPANKITIGGGSSNIFVSTSRHHLSISIYASWEKYLIPPVAKALNLLETYSSSHAHIYKPKRTIALIYLNESPSGKTQAWPSQLPKISELMVNKYFLDESSSSPTLAIFESNDQILLAQLMPKWGFSQNFKEGDKTYSITARPLLPHEEDTNVFGNTGIYEVASNPYGGGCEARVLQLSEKQAIMQLSCNHGAPSYNMGLREDLIEMNGVNGDRSQINTDDCKVNIRFWGDALTLDHLDGGCGLGDGVYPHGNLKLVSKSVTGFWDNPGGKLIPISKEIERVMSKKP